MLTTVTYPRQPRAAPADPGEPPSLALQRPMPSGGIEQPLEETPAVVARAPISPTRGSAGGRLVWRTLDMPPE